MHDRGTHAQLARWSLERYADGELCQPARLVPARNGCVRIDPAAGVPLACVTIAFDDCDKPYVSAKVDAVWPRRLAVPNELLFDLIRGCDLTRIEDVGWRDWLTPDRRVRFGEFRKMFKQAGRNKPVPTRFTVTFSGPVRATTLTRDIVAFTLVQRDNREAVGDVLRVPVVGLELAEELPGDPPGTVRGCSLLVDYDFWDGEIRPERASGFERETLIEIEIRTGFVLDCLGQEVAGGGRTVPSSGTVPGGRFLSSFTVVPDRDYAASAEQSAPAQTAQEA